jgi:alkylation response protein AidB-like acyl-CoA dehydrogenase
MRFSYTPEQESLRVQLRGYYAGLLDDRTRSELDADPRGPAMRRVVKQMAGDGWLGLGWPEEHGGQGMGPVEQYIFFDETMRAAAPFPVIAVNLIGPTLMQHGTAEQCAEHLPRIVGGDSFFCIGYSEPEAGTDLAGLRTTAVRDGDHYVVNGLKTWTSYHTSADYCWLAARTDPEAPKHKGLSVLIVPMRSPGIEVTPLDLLNDHDIATIRYEDVRVPVANVVGAENRGWSVITSQLNHERTTMGAPGVVATAFDDVMGWAAATVLGDGGRVIDRSWVRGNLGRACAILDRLKLMSWSNINDVAHNRGNVAKVSATKVAATEGFLDVLGLLIEVVGQPAGPPDRTTDPSTSGAHLAARLDHMYRHHLALTFGGGANEVQREIIATQGLGLPRSR